MLPIHFVLDSTGIQLFSSPCVSCIEIDIKCCFFSHFIIVIEYIETGIIYIIIVLCV